jgi:PKD repeat protein
VYDIIDKVPNNGKYDAYNSTNYVDSVHPNQAGNKLIGNAFAKYVTALRIQEHLKLSANFSADLRSGYVPLRVQFTDLSKNATGWNWDFGDGTSSTARNPAHKYNKAGKYTVKLTVKNSKGTNSVTKPGYILVK